MFHLESFSVRSLFLLTALAAFTQAYAQNVVPNPSFEDYTVCPDGLGQIGNATGWSTFSLSPDYFNACSAMQLTGVPANAFGYQTASSGGAYIGCYTYRNGTTTRECAQAQLLAPLEPGIPVHLSMSVATGGFGTNSVRWASSGVGIRFSTQPVPPGLLITNQAALYLETVQNDTASWVVLSSIFVPDSAYAFIQVGNFFSDELTDLELLDEAGATDGAYAFVDALCVSESNGVCQVKNGLVDHITIGHRLNVQQIGNELVIGVQDGVSSMYEFVLYDSVGRLIYGDRMICGDQCHIVLAPLAPGLYHLHTLNTAGVLFLSKLFLN